MSTNETSVAVSLFHCDEDDDPLDEIGTKSAKRYCEIAK
jgi:hypothetical protein